MTETKKSGYAFDPCTREFVSQITLPPSPDGQCYLPEHTVEVAPSGVLQDCEAFRLVPDGTSWEIVPDYRFKMLWSTATASPRANELALGSPLPEGVTTLKPINLDSNEPECNVWDEGLGMWKAAPDYSRQALWLKADASIAPPLPPGTALPSHVTDHAPPRDRIDSVRFDDFTKQWVAMDASSE